jgi:nucleoside-diphosphate-sugar epimerase
MIVVVTGAGGFVGDALCRRLSASGCRVVGIFRDQPAPRDWMEIRTTGDLTQLSDFNDLVEGADTVIHLAARLHMMRDTATDPELAFREANTDVTQRLAQAAAAAGTGRFVFLSSVKVNGEETTGVPFSERDAPAPEDAYGRSKRDAEVALQKIAATTKMAVTTLRVPLVYGPSVRANFAALLRICDTVLPLPLDGITHNRRSLLYLGNLTHALETVIKSDNDPSGTYLLSDGEDMSTAELVSHLRRSLNRHSLRLPVPASVLRSIASLVGKQDAVRRLCGSLQVDSMAFQKEFGWVPPFSPAQGIAATAAAHRATR